MAKYRYEPRHEGWIGISDSWSTLAWLDCRGGGAQEAFDDLCRSLERAGWELEKRSFDWRYVRRGKLRWEIRIGVLGPGERVRGPYDPR